MGKGEYQLQTMGLGIDVPASVAAELAYLDYILKKILDYWAEGKFKGSKNAAPSPTYPVFNAIANAQDVVARFTECRDKATKEDLSRLLEQLASIPFLAPTKANPTEIKELDRRYTESMKTIKRKQKENGMSGRLSAAGFGDYGYIRPSIASSSRYYCMRLLLLLLLSHYYYYGHYHHHCYYYCY
jgi:hypothetical protein